MMAFFPPSYLALRGKNADLIICRETTDQIIVLRDGSVAEPPGTHEQLVNSGGVYSSLWAGESLPILSCLTPI